MKTLVLFDANSFVHRAYHALPPLTTPEGAPIQAVYGIASILLKLIKEDRPDYAVALFDRPEPTFREQEYAEYKAQRPKAPDELISQIIESHNLFHIFGIKTFESSGYEADDLIATFAERFGKSEDVRVIILSGDRDTLQLIRGDRVVVRMPKKGLSDTATYNEARLKEEYGLTPETFIDYKALIGDASDNIKGVPGVGPKTAQKILSEFSSIEDFYARGKDTKEFERLLPHHEAALFAKKLVTLDAHVPVDGNNIESLRFEPDERKIESYFERMGFKALIKRIRGEDLKVVPKAEPGIKQGGLF